ncbi:alpha/beta hydrolase [Streptomyces jeddahensis]|uniref:Haloalkane dehalogenase n=1 Tax=Streptomyces jeddahensis TaxID=1716141 RepID=A0A177HGV4_9ACTN|nr:alpha/beta fold hydrolase [Streptomyces jeddahensis]OAH10202.1 haloalkane dehalogenase [Streptomyces jeddahensis]
MDETDERDEGAIMAARGATFVLVSGCFTGGWIWQEVVDQLRDSGAEVHPVTLTGMGDRRDEAAPGTDLETHIEEVVRLIDGVDAPEVVIVGHDYGIHPVLGAADRRPERITRIVYLDAGMPQDGDAALQLVPNQEVRRRLLGRSGQAQAGDDWRIPAPAFDEWQRWGSTAGLADEALDRLTRLAAPQPAGTLTQPLKLSGAVAHLPTTGVLCTGSGLNIALIEDMVAGGLPQFQALADPEVGFFELATGHWPMLSCPDELTEVLLRAAAGEGHRITAPGEVPAYMRPFVLDVPERTRERVGRMDLYVPDELAEAEGPRPAVVFVHGGPVPADLRPTPRDWPAFVGYGRYAASLGVFGVTLDHRLHGFDDYGRAAEDIAETVDLLRADPRIDPERIALWYFSGGGLLLADSLAEPPSWLRCAAVTYPVLVPLPGWPAVESRFRPAAAVSAAGRLPIVLTRVGLENAEIAATVEEFLAAAKACGADVEVIDVPDGHHVFDTIDHTEQSRRAVERAMRTVVGHLRG